MPDIIEHPVTPNTPAATAATIVDTVLRFSEFIGFSLLWL